MTAIADNLATIRARIAAAAQAAGRDTAAVTLVAVAKTYGADAVEAALATGQRVFGENRVQEAMGKYPALRAAHPELELHLIGPLQTNKVKEAVALFDVIETVDRPKLAAALKAEMTRTGKQLRCFAQINTGKEPQKAGLLPEDADARLSEFRDTIGLPIDGLMCIPPLDADPVPHFTLLREIAKRHGLATLSMGMSSDFELAVRHGATHVRIGTAIFGARPPLTPG
jgi:pyridoxal phosphate enzyme (YggS family)